MPSRVRSASSFKDYVETGEWPEAVLKKETPIQVHYAQEIACALANSLRDLDISLREAARRTGVDRATISRTLEGETIADLATLALLEQGLHARLWPLFSPR
jgi:transcriptional regulator with XRE-family HTH domain